MQLPLLRQGERTLTTIEETITKLESAGIAAQVRAEWALKWTGIGRDDRAHGQATFRGVAVGHALRHLRVDGLAALAG